MSVVLNGHTYSLAVLSGADGRDYARPEPFTASGATLWDMFFTDLVAHLASAQSVASVSPGATGGLLRSNGSAWARVAIAQIMTDIGFPANAAGALTNNGAGAFSYVAAAGSPKFAILTGATSNACSDAAWTKRTLAELYDPDGIVTVSSSQFTLAAGTYRIQGMAVADKYNTAGEWRTQLRIRNTTDSTNDCIGINSVVSATTTSHYMTQLLTVDGLVTIAGSKVFELDQWSYTGGTGAVTGGVANNAGIDRFAQVVITKLA